MLEIPEANVISNQINQYLKGKKIIDVIPNKNPHKLCWFVEDPFEYKQKLMGKKIKKSNQTGGMIEITVDNHKLVFGDGVQLLWTKKNEEIPKKHQLLLQFDDDSFFVAKVQMYGGIWCFKEGEWENEYYEIAKKKPSPLSNKFDFDYFKGLIKIFKKKSAKAFLATEQRIPGLGNGVLQDILFNANIHPKTKIDVLTEEDIYELYKSVKETLVEMVDNGGRDTERDLLGNSGGYKTKMSKNTVGKSCPKCDSEIKKGSYMGGSIYYCERCQQLKV